MEEMVNRGSEDFSFSYEKNPVQEDLAREKGDRNVERSVVWFI